MSQSQSSLIDRLLREKEHRPAKDYAPTVKDWFKSEFNRDLPVANIGLSDFHRKVGWEHSRAFDVSLHPDSAEGKRLISYLNSQGIPYLAQTGASSKNGRVTSTGPHIHIGPPSSSMSKRSLVDRLIEQKSVGTTTDPFAGVSGGASGEQREKIDHPYNISRILTEAAHSPEAEVRSQIRKQVQQERGKLRATARAPVALIELKPLDLFRSEENIVESEVESRRQAQERQSSPEMTKLRTEYGAMSGTIPTPMGVPLPTRSVVQSLAKAGGSLLKLSTLGGVTSVIPPMKKFNEWANARGQIVEEAASLSPLTPTGEEIVRSVPEKVATAIGDTGLSIAQIVLLKKATGLPMGRLLALETAAKTSDQPMSERANAVAKSYAMGKVLERHLSRPASAALFGVPTAIEQGAELSKGHGTLFDALLNVGIQAGTGFALGGGKKSSLVERLVAEKGTRTTAPKVEDLPGIPEKTTVEPKTVAPKLEVERAQPVSTETAPESSLRLVETETKEASTPQTETGPPPSESSTMGEKNQKHPSSQPLTGTKVDITRAERQERGLDPVQQQAYTAIGEAYNTGRAAVEGGSVDPRGLAESVAALPRPLSKSEIGSLGFDRARLSNARAELNNELNTAIAENKDVSDIQVRLKQVERALDFNDQALEKGGREQSEAFNARRMLVLHDYSLGDVLQRAKAAKGAELTPRERTEYTELQQKYEKVLAQLNETERKTATDTLQRDINRISKSKQRTETKELLDAEFAVLQTQFRQARKEVGGVQASGLAGIDPEGKLTALVLRMAQNRIKAGVTKAEQLVDDIYNAVKDSVEGLTPDDVRNVLKGLPSQRTARLEKQIGEMEAGTWTKQEHVKPTYTKEERDLIATRDRLKQQIEYKLKKESQTTGERWWKNASGARKAWLLSGPMTHVRNILGTGLYQPFDEAARIPAVVADAVVSRFRGRRSFTGPSPTAMLDSVIHAVKVGGHEAKGILRYGTTPEDMARHQFSEVNTGVKAIDIAHNAIFRIMSASDRVFFQYAHKRNLIDRALVQAKNERATDPSVNVRDRARELIENPSEELDASSKHDALVSTFNNNNALSDAIQRGRSHLPPAANFAIDLVMPFDRTPTNVIARVIEASPAGYVKNAKQLAQAVVKKSMTDEEARDFARTFGRATAGTVLITLGWHLASKGVLDWDSKNGQIYLNVFGRRFNINTVSPIGTLFAVGAAQYRAHTAKRKPTEYSIDDRAGAALRPLKDQPLLRGTQQVTDILSFREWEAQRAAGYFGYSFVPFSGAVRTVAEVTDENERRAKTTKEYFQMNVPYWREQLPKKNERKYRR